MVKAKNNKKESTAATEVLTYATKEEEDAFLGLSTDEDEEMESAGDAETPRKKAMEVDMSEDDGSVEDESVGVEEDEGDDEEEEEGVEDDGERPFDRKSSKELANAYKDQNERTVFVGNITPKMTKKVLIQLFNSEKAGGPGAVDTVRIRGAITQEGQSRQAKRRAVIQHKFKDEDTQILCAFVVLKKKESVEKCLRLNNHIVDGKHLRVDVIKGKKMTYEGSNCVFVGNIPFNCNEEQVREAFSKCGDVKSVRLVRSKEDGIPKGFGYVEFSESMGVDFSLKLKSGLEIGGRQVRIQKWSGKETQQNRRKVPKNEKEKSVPSKKRKVIIPTNMHSLEVTEYIKSKQKKLNRKADKKKAFVKDKKVKSKTRK